MFPCRFAVVLLGLLSAAPALAQYPHFPGERYTLGRSIWLENCETCHGYGIAGAPLATDRDQWSDRIGQGRNTLYQHALEGFFGPGGTMMPPRGGNESLKDSEVTAAVDYMVRLATGTELNSQTGE